MKKKITSNSSCPCGSKIKYKKCCAIYHKGAIPKTALLLMRSRYSAYATYNSAYIMKTTHCDNSDYTTDSKVWKESIEFFTKSTEFLGLTVLESIDGEDESFVIFKAKLSSGEMLEKSRFLKVDGCWLYESGEISHEIGCISSANI